jgi:hypothetical protein
VAVICLIAGASGFAAAWLAVVIVDEARWRSYRRDRDRRGAPRFGP